MDYKETVKERMEILSQQLRDFVLNESWRNDVETIGRKFNFDEEKLAMFENEVFLVLLCFEPKTDFAENIKNELGIDSNTADFIVEDVEKNIFNKVASELDSFEKQMSENEKEEVIEEIEPEKETPIEPKNSVGESFEQIILNQARAMMPARPADEAGRSMNYESRIMNGKEEKPSNLPIDEQKLEEKTDSLTKIEEPSNFPPDPVKTTPIEKTTSDKQIVHDYAAGNDPYREPIE
jgi:hypothetical protein